MRGMMVSRCESSLCSAPLDALSLRAPPAAAAGRRKETHSRHSVGAPSARLPRAFVDSDSGCDAAGSAAENSRAEEAARGRCRRACMQAALARCAADNPGPTNYALRSRNVIFRPSWGASHARENRFGSPEPGRRPRRGKTALVSQRLWIGRERSADISLRSLASETTRAVPLRKH